MSAPSGLLESKVRQRLLRWYSRHKRDLPWRKSRDPYRVWLSEIMLQQTQVATALPYYKRFLQRFPTVLSLASADLGDVLKLWAGLGYYARARNMHRAARVVATDLAGRFPLTVEGLRALPGVGAYTAAAIASIAYETPAAVVDGNVKRVMARLFDLRTDVGGTRGVGIVQKLADRLMPERRCGDFNQAVMELGATVCLPGAAANCKSCPLRGVCQSFASGTVHRRPVIRDRTKVTSQTHIVAAIRNGNRWFTVQRPEKGLWGGLWELPTTEANGLSSAKEAARLAGKLVGRSCRPEPGAFCRSNHVLSHRKIEFIGHVCDFEGARRAAEDRPGQKWVTRKELDALPLSTAMRRVLGSLDRHLEKSGS